MADVLIVGGAPGHDGPVTGAIVRDARYVIAVDRGAEACRLAGRVPDLFVGDADSVSAETFEWARVGGAKTLVLPVDKDHSDLDAALSEARRLGLADVAITCITGGRTDHMLVAVYSLLEFPDLRPMIVEPALGGWVLDAKHRSAVSVAGAGRVVSVLAGCSGANVSITGTRWELERADLSPFSSHGLSNRIVGAGCLVTCHQGSCLVLSPSTGGMSPDVARTPGG